MNIKYLYIDSYKNLSSFEIHFEPQINMIALAGKNGSGKSNVLEAIAKIFASIISINNLGFKFTIHYTIHGDNVVATNTSGSLQITKNGAKISKADFRTIMPITIFLYYAGETNRLKDICEVTIDKIFDKCIKDGETPSYKLVSYLSIDDFGLSLMVNKCFGLEVLNDLQSVVGIEDISKKCIVHLKRPSWGKNGKPELFWNAKGYVAEVINFLKNNGSYSIINKDKIIISIENCEILRDTLMGPEGLFKSLKILMQADILNYIEINVVKDGQTINCDELSEGEKQLANILSILNFTKDYNALFLLDEFDSYLHPSWQRTFAAAIDFENLTGQIIFTTHSPLTLSQMKRENVFLLREGAIFGSGIDTYNRDVSEIMGELMDVPLRPEHIEELIKKFNKSVALKSIDDAKKLRAELIELLSKEDPFLITANLSIARLERK